MTYMLLMRDDESGIYRPCKQNKLQKESVKSSLRASELGDNFPWLHQGDSGETR